MLYHSTAFPGMHGCQNVKCLFTTNATYEIYPRNHATSLRLSLERQLPIIFPAPNPSWLEATAAT